jgi:hypothetical protein
VCRLLVCVARLLLPIFEELTKIAAVRRARRKDVDVVGHETVRRNFELLLGRDVKKLHTNGVDHCGFSQAAMPIERSK